MTLRSGCWLCAFPIMAAAFLLAGCGGQPSPLTVGECQASDTQTREKDGMAMVCVPAGEFLMGSTDADPDAEDDEKPQHAVYLDAFWIDRTEVTNAQYRRCGVAGGCTEPAFWSDSNYNAPDQPVVGVDWDQATAYCDWAGGRLPTEAEWEKAARGTDGRIYPWGESAPNCDKANYGNCVGRPAAVGSYPAGASPYGALEMAGNVWEWVSDWYDDGYYASLADHNPQGPSSGTYRGLRGGSWYDNSGGVRSAYRGGDSPDFGNSLHGFRCSLAATSSP